MIKILATLTALCLVYAAALGLPADWEANYRWHPEKSTSGPVLVVVDLDDQEALVYRNGIEIGMTPVSTGKPGHETPTGVFQILNKDAHHHSSTYHNASMPFSERLTWGGVALHAGGLPGYPSSHGCIHLPYSFSKKLFQVTHCGTTVVVTKEGKAPDVNEHPIDAVLTLETEAQNLPAEAVVWEPHKSKDGPLTVFFSGKDDKVEVFRDGVLIGSAPMSIKDPSTNLPSSVMILLEDETGKKHGFSNHGVTRRWAVLGVSKAGEISSESPVRWLRSQVRLPDQFAKNVVRLLGPGSLLVTTPEPVTADSRSANGFQIMKPAIAPQAFD